ncbi:MAG: nitroreductase family protein [Thermodesulfobacteriota bacterium]
MELQAFEKLVKERRSVRKWRREDVPDELIRKAIELATWAPNGGNYQGWHFLVVKNRETIVRMADAVQSISDRIASWPEAKQWQADVDRYRTNASFFRNAPVVIAAFTEEYRSVMDRVLLTRESFDPEAKQVLAFRRSAPTSIQSVAAAVATMLLAFHQMGLGAVWLGAPLMAKREIETILKVPSNLSLICLVAVGYGDESPQKDRKPVDKVIKFLY